MKAQELDKMVKTLLELEELQKGTAKFIDLQKNKIKDFVEKLDLKETLAISQISNIEIIDIPVKTKEKTVVVCLKGLYAFGFLINPDCSHLRSGLKFQIRPNVWSRLFCVHSWAYFDREYKFKKLMKICSDHYIKTIFTDCPDAADNNPEHRGPLVEYGLQHSKKIMSMTFRKELVEEGFQSILIKA